MLAELSAVMREVGGEIMLHRERGNTGGHWEGAQFKAIADLIADRCMRSGLLRIADLPVVSEEDPASQAASRPAAYWLIDPIDGTASFAHGFPGFVCQAALMRDGRPHAAAVFAPALNRMYLAERGKGATINGERLRAPKVDRDDLKIVDNYPEPRGIAGRLFADLRCSGYVESGSIGLKICRVADGTANVFVKDVVLRDWDVAAPHLILEESGGAFAMLTGGTYSYTGAFEKLGLIAAASTALLREVSLVIANYGHTSR